mmetsp:Transcript_15355/g.46090  ORF Transcript_15355/g.46090 Transcript_15355/m.46090 type:complete len:304 (+) Transcript_15355:843-1754(+)
MAEGFPCAHWLAVAVVVAIAVAATVALALALALAVCALPLHEILAPPQPAVDPRTNDCLSLRDHGLRHSRARPAVCPSARAGGPRPQPLSPLAIRHVQRRAAKGRHEQLVQFRESQRPARQQAKAQLLRAEAIHQLEDPQLLVQGLLPHASRLREEANAHARQPRLLHAQRARFLGQHALQLFAPPPLLLFHPCMLSLGTAQLLFDPRLLYHGARRRFGRSLRRRGVKHLLEHHVGLEHGADAKVMNELRSVSVRVALAISTTPCQPADAGLAVGVARGHRVQCGRRKLIAARAIEQCKDCLP